MKALYTAHNIADAHALRGYLESQGIAAVVRGEHLIGGVGHLPAGLCKVWVTDDGQLREAQALLERFLRGAAARELAAQTWRCASCGETLEGQFTDCWNCGAARPA